jgi:Ca-activated chloride channel family protein
MVLPGMLQYQESAQTHGLQGDPFTISVSVNMVVVNATAHDRKGAPVSDLVKEDFQVYEDGVLQQIECFSHEDIPVTVGLVIDNSGTMRPKRAEVITAALAFARSSNPRDQMFAVNFNENISFDLPDNVTFTDNVAQLEMALAGITANGLTALYDAVAAALDHLNKGDREKKVLIVISDGDDNSSKHDLAGILDMAGQSDAIIYTIGVYDVNNPDRNPRALRELAKATGGEAFFPDSAKDVVSICKRIAHDIRSQYSIAYISTNKRKDGRFRAISVTARARDGMRLSVRTRAGYYAPLESESLPTSEQPHED